MDRYSEVGKRRNILGWGGESYSGVGEMYPRLGRVEVFQVMEGESFLGCGEWERSKRVSYCGEGKSIPELGGLELFWGVDGERYPRVGRGRMVLGWGGAEVL